MTVCDRCGKEAEQPNTFLSLTSNSERRDLATIDLCKQCTNKLTNLVMDFVNEKEPKCVSR